jgi:hypothetical protein
VKDIGGAQRKNLLVIKYFTPFTATNIFHMLSHAVDELVLRRDPDPDHKNAAWWEAAEKIQERVEEKLYGSCPVLFS